MPAVLAATAAECVAELRTLVAADRRAGPVLPFGLAELDEGLSGSGLGG